MRADPVKPPRSILFPALFFDLVAQASAPVIINLRRRVLVPRPAVPQHFCGERACPEVVEGIAHEKPRTPPFRLELGDAPTLTPTATPTPTSTPTDTPTATPTETPTPACVGDCNDSGTVIVHELVTGVNIAMGTLPQDDCSSFDTNHDDRVTVDELVKAVDAALNRCGGREAKAGPRDSEVSLVPR